MRRTISIQITGKVQGVFFRETSRKKAKELDISGEVRNLQDGSVAIIASGENERLDEFVEWCHVGPPDAIVESVDISEKQLQEFNDFRVLRA